MDCAIACLRKSNALSDYEKRPLLTSKEYLRLVKYIESTGDMELAKKELENIYQKHPEFSDKRFSNLLRIKESLAKNKKYKNDLYQLGWLKGKSSNRHVQHCASGHTSYHDNNPQHDNTGDRIK